ncbi:uncharacterized protein Dvir_GJ26369 [Drosophila virilis]|uniref:Uncharacterized protein n=1 Tax=Drosophila virilis TaxID=7244 RepID=A0A0Q9W7M9_DROVI|nr:uncharacterized protein Dvir_GJ26369 [Drosophila virilis]
MTSIPSQAIILLILQGMELFSAKALKLFLQLLPLSALTALVFFRYFPPPCRQRKLLTTWLRLAMTLCICSILTMMSRLLPWC